MELPNPDDAEIHIGTKKFYFPTNERAVSFADELPECVDWVVRCKGTGVRIESQHYRAQKADEGRKR